MSLIHKYVHTLEWIMEHTYNGYSSGGHYSCSSERNFVTIADIVELTFFAAITAMLFSWWRIPLLWLRSKTVYRDGGD